MILPLLFVWAQYVPNLNANAVKLLELPVPLFQHSSPLKYPLSSLSLCLSLSL